MIELDTISKRYESRAIRVTALYRVSITIQAGEFVAMMGPSGCGKSTLLHIIGCLDTASSGSYRLLSRPIAELNNDELAQIRNHHIGFIFQSFNLLPQFNIRKNVEIPLLYSDIPRHEIQNRVSDAIARVGLHDRSDHIPSELSGGQQQRAAIARAIVNHPKLLLADEPTGNLDSASGHDIMALLKTLNSSGTTVIMVTHNPELAKCAGRTIRFLDGMITSDSVHE